MIFRLAPRQMFRCGPLLAGFVLLAWADAAGANLLLPPQPKETLTADILFLPDEVDALDRPGSPASARLVVTGAYSSGDRFAPEGFVIRDGNPTHPYPQGWDGLLLIDGDGRLSLHFIEAVAHAGRLWNLKNRDSRRAMVVEAQAAGLTALQSHLLIREGALDLSPVPGARKFRRRLLFETDAGDIGVWDTSPRQVTLYEAAAELQAAQRPRFALNLDMGAYDFCERTDVDGAMARCGVLGRAGMEKLTNLLVIEAQPFN